jgi:hypothetical protein
MGEDLAAFEFAIEVALLPAQASYRNAPVDSGYRPNHKHPLTGEYFMGQLELANPIHPGGTGHGHVRVLISPSQLDTLQVFGSWTIWEGPHHVGNVRVVS